MQGVDYAWSHPDPDVLKRQGFRFAMRYLSHDASKNLSQGELKALWARGISVGVVWESTANRALAGHDAGRQDALAADGLVRGLGLAGIPIHFAVDFDASDAQKPQIANYLRGAVSVLGHDRVGNYAGYWVVKYLVEHNVCRFHWQTYAWSGGRRHPRAEIYQYHNGVNIGGGDCDLNRAVEHAGALRGPGNVSPDPLRLLTKAERQACQRRCYHRKRHFRERRGSVAWARDLAWARWWKARIRAQMHAIQVAARASGGYGSAVSRRRHRAERYQVLAPYWTGEACK